MAVIAGLPFSILHRIVGVEADTGTAAIVDRDRGFQYPSSDRRR